MRVKERESWTANNVGKGGRKPSYSQFNKEFKGKERNPAAREFASMDIEEYHRYPDVVDTRKTEEKKQESSQSNTKSNKSNTSSKVTNKLSGIAKNIVSNVATLVVGAAVVVSSYQTMVTPTYYATNWNWSADYATASLEFLDEEGTILNEIPAVVTIIEEDATCNKEGTKTFNATVNDEDGNNYSDTHYQTIDPYGHVLKNGKIVQNDDGTLVAEYECEKCHEKITVTIGKNESD